ncbi:hypothetical protein ABIB62_003085 [Mucilaginibacter sp. UYP25]
MNIKRSYRYSKVIKVGLLLVVTALMTTCIYIFTGHFIAKEDKGSQVRLAKVSICMPAKQSMNNKNHKK